ncbi:MAG TPA: SDR family oxidoreductase [Herpetosiphonaceae bacterium]|nr:SDR family oxidoreductase [Herpetosiphonaceae bacterium]
MAQYLVTGGGGFIGSHLVDKLLELGHSVRVLDNFATGRRQNLAHCLADIDLIEGDLREADTVLRAAAGCEVILHQGALPSVPRSVADPVTSNAVNVVGTLNVLQAARERGARRVVIASSSSIYGDTPTLPKVESMPMNPRSPYATSKMAAETYTRIFADVYGMETVALRYFNVFGPRQDPGSQYSGVIAKFMTFALRGQTYTINGDGSQSRDFTYVANAVQANMLAATTPGVNGAVINIACGQRITLNDLTRILNKLVGRDIPTAYGPPRTGDVEHSLADIGQARALLGYEPLVDVETGLARTLDWYREHEA